MEKVRYARILAAILLNIYLVAQAVATQPVQITGGVSPDRKVAVVVQKDEDTSQCSVTTSNEHPYLENLKSGEIIGPLEEVDTMGGGFGNVLSNVTAYWSPDNTFLCVRFRAGRLIEEFVIYRIEQRNGGYRAVPQKLPDMDSGPNGSKIFANTSQSVNSGEMFDRWVSTTEISIKAYRYFPHSTEPDIDFFNGDGIIDVHYSIGAKGWFVSGYMKPSGP